MGVRVTFHCGGCDAVVQGRTSLGKRWIEVRRLGNLSKGYSRIDSVEDLAPEGWVVFDPYTFATYCPACWASIIDPEDD